jgi:hypothetical protein
MKYRIGVVELNRENQFLDLVKLLGGKRNCFHYRRRIDGGLKKLKPLKAVVLDQEENLVADLPKEYVDSLVKGLIDVGDPVSIYHRGNEVVIYVDMILQTFKSR